MKEHISASARGLVEDRMDADVAARPAIYIRTTIADTLIDA